MIKVEQKNLYVFGYGLALIIPFLVLLRSFRGGLGPLSFILLFLIGMIVIMVALPRIALLRPWKNLWILIFQIAALDGEILSGPRPAAMVFLGFAIVILMITIWKAQYLKTLYIYWMKGAHGLGLVMSGLILCLIFYLVFAPVGLILRLLRKDLLGLRIEPDKESYWHKRDYVFNKENYKRQF